MKNRTRVRTQVNWTCVWNLGNKWWAGSKSITDAMTIVYTKKTLLAFNSSLFITQVKCFIWIWHQMTGYASVLPYHWTLLHLHNHFTILNILILIPYWYGLLLAQTKSSSITAPWLGIFLLGCLISKTGSLRDFKLWECI